MKLKHVLGVVLLLALGVCSSGAAEPAAGVSPPRRTLTIPLSPASAGEYSVACGMALPLSAVAFSPDGKTLAVGGYREVLLWDLAAGKLAKRIGAGQIGSMVQAVLFTKDGKSLAEAEGTPCAAGAVKVFDLQSGQVAMNFQEPKGVVFSLDLSPDGKLLAAGCSDAAAYVWSLPEKKLVTTLKDHIAGGGQRFLRPRRQVPGDRKPRQDSRRFGTLQPGSRTARRRSLEAPPRRCCLRETVTALGGRGKDDVPLRAGRRRPRRKIGSKSPGRQDTA